MKVTKIAMLVVSVLILPQILSAAEVNQAQEDLWSGVRVGNVAKIKQALASGADVNMQDWLTQTSALMWAITINNSEIVKLLLGVEDINVNMQDKEGNTALILAVIEDNPEIVKLLLDAGADPTMKDIFGWTALDRAKGEIAEMLARKMLAVTEEQRQELAKKQDDVDALTFTEDITSVPLDKLIILGQKLYLKKGIMDYMISQLGSKEFQEKNILLDPYRNPIPKTVQTILLAYFKLPKHLLSKGGPIYEDAVALQRRENWIQMTGEPETEKQKQELEELENEAAMFRERIRDTLKGLPDPYHYGEY